MAATFDAATDGSGTSVSSITVSHTATGTDRAAFAGGGAVDFGSGTPTASATYAGSAMTERWDAAFATFYAHHGYTLVAPATGAQNVVLTWNVTAGGSFAVVTATSVDQTTPFGTPATATGSSTTPSVNVSAATNDLVVDNLVYVGTGTATAGTNQTARTSNTNVGGEIGHYTSTEAGATTTTMSYTIASSNWAIGGIAFKAAAAAGGTGRLVNGCLVNGLLTGYLA